MSKEPHLFHDGKKTEALEALLDAMVSRGDINSWTRQPLTEWDDYGVGHRVAAYEIAIPDGSAPQSIRKKTFEDLMAMDPQELPRYVASKRKDGDEAMRHRFPDVLTTLFALAILARPGDSKAA